MNAIVAVDKNWGIGNRGQLLVSIPGDHKNFRRLTLDKTVVYGRKTLETFPMRQVLDRRDNIILTRNQNLSVRGALMVHSVEELLRAVKDKNPDDVYVIGGASVYRELLPYCDKVIVTKIDLAYEADAYFPNLDKDPDFEITDESEEATYFDAVYTFVTYTRRKQA